MAAGDPTGMLGGPQFGGTGNVHWQEDVLEHGSSSGISSAIGSSESISGDSEDDSSSGVSSATESNDSISGDFENETEFQTSQVQTNSKNLHHTELFHSTVGLGLQGFYIIYRRPYEDTVSVMNEHFCGNEDCEYLGGTSGSTYGETGSSKLEDSGNYLEIQGRCILFHEPFTNPGTAIHKAGFYYTNWDIIYTARKFLNQPFSDGFVAHDIQEFPTLNNSSVYVTVIFLNERPADAKSNVIYGDCFIFPAENMEKLQPIVQKHCTCSFNERLLKKKLQWWTETVHKASVGKKSQILASVRLTPKTFYGAVFFVSLLTVNFVTNLYILLL